MNPRGYEPVPGLTGARLAITGAAGFVGSHLCALLRASGADVIGIDRVPGAALTADLMDPASRDEIYDAIHTADGLIHLAASGARTDMVGALAVAMGALRPDVPVVVTSCSSVYGSSILESDGRWRGSREDDPVRPLGSHGRSHVLIERLSTRRRLYGNRVALIRPFTIAGEGQPESAAIARWISAASRGEVLELPGGPERVRDVVDVVDAVRAIAVAWREEIDGIVNVGTGRPVRVEQVIEAIAAEFGPVDHVRVPASKATPLATCASVERMSEWLGFVGETDLGALIRRQIRAVRSEAAA